MIKSYGQVIFCFSPSLSLFLKGSTIPNSFHGNLKSFLISRLLLKKQFLKGIKPSIVYLGERERQRQRGRDRERDRERVCVCTTILTSWAWREQGKHTLSLYKILIKESDIGRDDHRASETQGVPVMASAHVIWVFLSWAFLSEVRKAQLSKHFLESFPQFWKWWLCNHYGVHSHIYNRKV